ncbi:hypothetical protein PAHAL_9G251100 [Panicum hallii]|uniref:Uncharacterized protein n=1 Tax=Panicum hallii TaxID=206008 RepID=A0A2T8I2H6_9POAL|nr:hypothetical protein PAHAL_9G251100 [Panicum hallii]PVH31882.1 hypothetical protein PAHAL_9G251100 [Panicum hallii]
MASRPATHRSILRPPPPSLISSSSARHHHLSSPLPLPSPLLFRHHPLFVLQIWLELPPPLWQGQSAQARVAPGGAGGGLYRQLHECPRPISVTAHTLPVTVRGPPYIWRRAGGDGDAGCSAAAPTHPPSPPTASSFIKPLDRVLAEVKGWRA